jgi:DNA helicase-2/ATP-dependent DNA helicase PcrA
MHFEHNVQRDLYIASRGKTVLNACPGSGKTTCIVKKIETLSVECLDIYGAYSGIACLSFTNTAKDEILKVYQNLYNSQISYPHTVSTIDSFINTQITLPFYYLAEFLCKRPNIIDSTNFIDELWKEKFKYKNKKNKSFCFKYPPSSISIDSSGDLSSNGFTPNPLEISVETWQSYCQNIMLWKLNKGFITTSDSAHIALDLLTKYPQIGRLLSRRYPYLIIDEAQDTSGIQHDVFEMLHKLGLCNIDLVGDPYQSLYEWRGAKPDIFINKHEGDCDWKGLNLTDNRRSPQHIVDAFSIIRRSTDQKINSTGEDSTNFPILAYKYNDDNMRLIIDAFDDLCKSNCLSENKVVVRGNKLKNSILGVDIEQKPWKEELPYKLIEAKNLFDGGDVKGAFGALRKDIVEILYKEFTREEKLRKVQELKGSPAFNSSLFNFISEIPSLDLSLKDWTSKAEEYVNNKLKYELPFGLKDRKSKYFDKSIVDKEVSIYFPKPFTSGNIPVKTIHQVKGESLDSILIFFSKKKHNENICFSDISILESCFPKEKRRLIYVAASRPRHILAFAFHESVSNKDIRNTLGENIVILDKNDLDPCLLWTFKVEVIGRNYKAYAYNPEGAIKLTYTHQDKIIAIDNARSLVKKYLIK